MRVAPAVLAVLLVAVVPGAVRAAEITDVADGPEGDEPLDLSLTVRWVRSQERALIRKEVPVATGIESSKELRYESVTSALDLTARVGVAPNVELRVGVPVVLSRTAKWWLPAGVSADDSVIATNEFGTGTCPGRGEEFGGWRQEVGDDGALVCVPNVEALEAGAEPVPFAPLFPVPAERRFSGLGDPHFGIRIGLLDEEADDANPTWVLDLAYVAPLAPVADPAAANTEADPGAVGEGFHRFRVETAISKRVRWFDPYAGLRYQLSVASGKAFRNCDHPENLPTPENCGQGTWDEDETGPKPRHVGGLLVGAELTPWEEARKDRRFLVDARFFAEYHSEGRDYSPAAWMLERLTYTEDFGRFGGRLEAAFEASRHFRFGLDATLSYDTAHALTRESIGEDLDANGQVDLDNRNAELNPNFDFRYDVPGRRLIADEIWNFAFGAHARVSL